MLNKKHKIFCSFFNISKGKKMPIDEKVTGKCRIFGHAVESSTFDEIPNGPPERVESLGFGMKKRRRWNPIPEKSNSEFEILF